jgi:hypothetical protein
VEELTNADRHLDYFAKPQKARGASMFCGLAAAEKLSPPRTEKYFVEGARYSACKIDPPYCLI